MIKFIIHDLKRLLWNHTGLCLILILSIATSTFGVLFFSGYFAYSYYDVLENERCKITLTLESDYSAQKIDSLLFDLSNNEFNSITSLSLSDREMNEFTYSENTKLSVIGRNYYGNNSLLLAGRSFKNNEENAVMLLSESILAQLEINDPLSSSININSTEYSIIGILLNSEAAYIIPVSNYLANYKARKITAIYQSKIANSIINKIVNDYDSIIYDCDVNVVSSPFLSQEFLAEFTQILLIFCFAFLNIISVIMFWQRIYEKEYEIYYICGCSKRMNFIIVFVQIIMIALIGIAMGFSIHMLFLPKFIQMSLIKESVVDCLIISFFVLMLTTLIASILSHKIIKKEKTDKRGDKYDL